ncbi:reverse transcriptase-like protein [Halotia branconii]|uniref:Reverse transcriptase-like protein n=1 Tax=Halotia branconii CENA392 TaxID=1539056 RepID=A0AAJ6NVQ0_9CYAN|nr:reverse transcriptase-like protein [Halotia branconii]WGV27366.1 reverse transcriptase-like protein [Halotia branconii CENA392]
MHYYSHPGFNHISSSQVTVYCYAISKKNPGWSIAATYNLDRKILATTRQYLGDVPKNIAEYHSIILGLKKSQELNFRNVMLCSNNLRVINQLQGFGEVDDLALMPLYHQVILLLSRFQFYKLEYRSWSEMKVMFSTILDMTEK